MPEAPDALRARSKRSVVFFCEADRKRLPCKSYNLWTYRTLGVECRMPARILTMSGME